MESERSQKEQFERQLQTVKDEVAAALHTAQQDAAAAQQQVDIKSLLVKAEFDTLVVRCSQFTRIYTTGADCAKCALFDLTAFLSPASQPSSLSPSPVTQTWQ